MKKAIITNNKKPLVDFELRFKQAYALYTRLEVKFRQLQVKYHRLERENRQLKHEFDQLKNTIRKGE